MGPPSRRARALFLDRDGTINIDHGYVHRIEDFEWMPGALETCALARDLGYRLIVVTNQAGIGRGYYDEAQYQALTRWILSQFAAAGVPLDKVYHCPFHPVHGQGAYRRASPWRKPAPGMLLQAARDFALDLQRCVLVGDAITDMRAAHHAGLAGQAWLRPTPGPDKEAPPPGTIVVPDMAAVQVWLRALAGDG